jgi:short-subunit dehydrogenase
MATDLKKTYGEWALITGATSGIGKAFVEELAAQGIHCILISNDSDALTVVKRELTDKNKHSEIVIKNIDLSDIAMVQDALSFQEFNKIRIVINCAGVGYTGAAVNQNLSNHLKMINVNLISPFILTSYFVDLFYKNHTRGAVVNISSGNAELNCPTPFSSVYTPTKVFLKHFTEGLAYEMQRQGIDLLNVACGPTDTGFQAATGTRKLAWCETPQSVVHKAISKLGRTNVVITNPVSKILIGLFKILPLPKRKKMKILAWYFGKLLENGQNLTLN